MDFDGAAGARAARGRVVMLVDNAVDGDSRVQKVARSAADAGWDVTLLGRAPDGGARSWRLGGAEVRLLPVPDPLGRRRHEFRRAWLRWPLAYPPNGIAAQRAQWVRAWQAELRVRAAALDGAVGAGRPPRRVGLRRLSLRARSAAAHATRRWVSFRYWQLTRARKGRRLDGPWDRLYAAFWRAVHGDGAWRRLEPGLWDWELAYGPVIDVLAPDLIHAHDFRMIGVGAMAAIRARAAGRPFKLIYDAHEYLPGIKPRVENVRWLPAHCAYEREFVPYADAVVTVSEGLADLLRDEHGLAERPVVVLNAPLAEPSDEERAGRPGDEPLVDLRTQCGIGPQTPLLVYSGGVSPVRGVEVMIEALPELPDVHVALVSLAPGRRVNASVRALLARAEELGVADRVHLLPFVPHWRVASFLSAADAAVSPLLHLTNHEIALSNKFFEYSYARLPIVVSDVRTMAETVRSTGQGEVFRAGDIGDYLRAVRAVLADPARYRAAYDKPGMLDAWTWEAQAVVLDAVYDRLLPDPSPGALT
jgi:glycosyltransferase involved in cell wall biosynthesis